MRFNPLIALGATLIACVGLSDEPVESSTAAIVSTYPTALVVPPTTFGSQEPSGTFASASRLTGSFNIPGFNQAWITGSVFGTTITPVLACDMFGNGTGAPCTTVPTGGLTNFARWHGDTTVVSGHDPLS